MRYRVIQNGVSSPFHNPFNDFIREDLVACFVQMATNIDVHRLLRCCVYLGEIEELHAVIREL